MQGGIVVDKSKRWSHDKEDYLLFPDNELMEMDVTVNGKIDLCVGRCLEFRAKNEIFMPQSADAEYLNKTNVITLFERDELMQMLKTGLLGIDITLYAGHIIISHYYPLPK